MKHLKTYEKYVHTSQDQIDDMNLINEFSKKFEDLFEFRLNLDRSGNPEFRGYLGYGASVHYFGKINLDNPRILKRKVDISYNVYLDTDINPNGITGEDDEDDIDRTFTIKFEISKNMSRNVNNIKNFYSYSRNMDEVLEKFNNYVSHILGIKQLTDSEKEERKKKKDFDKKIRQYNL